MTLPFGAGELRVASPEVLTALVVVPVFFVLGRGARLAAACRAAAAVATLLVLAGLSIERAAPDSGVCAVALIDVSASVGRAAADEASDFLGRTLPLLGVDDAVGSVAFAGRARVLAHPAGGLRALGELLPADGEANVDEDETDLAGALAAAAPLCPEGKQAALVAFTDGNETAGSALAEAALAEPRIPIFSVIPAAARLPAGTVRRLVAPARAPAHAVLPLEAVVEGRADGPRSAMLAITVNGASLLPVPVDLARGIRVVRLPYRFDDRGAYVLDARLLTAPGEPLAAGPASTAITVTRPVHVLVVTEHERPVVALALARRGMDVEVVAPAELSPHFEDYHVVVLDDVGRDALPDRVLDALARHVAGGGALVATGGPHLFGDAGFVGTPLERVLPIALQSQRPEPKEREPIALYVLVDRSNSMGYASSEPALGYGEKMEYAKRAALAVLDQLAPRDLVGAIAFDSQPYELGPLVPLADGRSALETKIRQLKYGGGTDFKDALETARRALVAAGQRVRHVILITDGDTNRRAEDHADVIAALARDDVTVTTIRIGSDTVNLDLLERISRATGGAFHHVEDVGALPQLMISDTQHVMDEAANRHEAAAHIADPGMMLAGIDEDELPRVSRWAISRPKPGADVRLYVDAGTRQDPLLATWQYELGRVAVMPMDFQSGAAGWATWRGFAKLWSQLVMWAAPPGLASEPWVEAQPVDGGTLVTVAMPSEPADEPALRLEDGTESALRPIGGRRYAAVVGSLAPGVHPATFREGDHETAVEIAIPSRSSSGREQRASGPNLDLLTRLAALSGGTVGPSPADLLRARAGVRRRAVPLDVILVPLALVLVLADVALRRLARPA